MAEVLAGNIVVSLVAKLGNFSDNMKTAQKSVDGLNQKIQKNKQAIQSAGKKIGAAGFAITGILGLMVREASSAQEIQNKFFAVFQEEAENATKWVNNFAKATGRSKIDLKRWSATLQDTFVPLGFANKEAREMSQTMTELAVDLASFSEETDDALLLKLQSAIVGNTETVRKYGIIITQASLQQELYNMGIDKNISKVTEQEKVQARINIIIRGSERAMRDAINTEGGYANRMKRFLAQMRDLSVAIGSNLIPILSEWLGKMAEVVSRITEWVKENPKLAKTITLVVAGLGTALTILGPLLFMLPFIVSGITLVANAAVLGVKRFGVAVKTMKMATMIEIVAITTAILLIIKYWDEILAALKTGWEVIIKPLFESLWTAVKALGEGCRTVFKFIWEKVIKPTWGFIVNAASVAIDEIGRGWEWMKNLVSTVWTFIWDKIKWTWEQVVSGFRWVMEKLGIDLPAIGEMFNQTFQGIADDNNIVTAGIGTSWETAKNTFGTVTDTMGEVGGELTDFLGGKWDEFGEAYDRNLEELRRKHEEVSDDATKTTKKTIERQEGIFSRLWNSLNTLWENIGDGMDLIGKSIVESVLTGGIGKGMNSLKDGFGHVFSKIKGNIIKSISAGLWETLKNKGFKDALSSIGSAISGIFGGKGGIGGMISKGVGAIGGALGLGGGTASAATSAAGATSGALAGAGGALSSAAGAIGSAAVAAAPFALAGLAAFGAFKGLKKLFGGSDNVFSGEQESVGHWILLKMMGLNPPGDGKSQNAVPYYRSNKGKKLKNGMKVDDVYRPIWQPFIEKLAGGDLDGAVAFAQAKMQEMGVLGIGLSSSAASAPARAHQSSIFATVARQKASGDFNPNSSIGKQFAALTRVSAQKNALASVASGGKGGGGIFSQRTNNINVNLSGNNINSELDMQKIAQTAGKEILKQVTNQETVNF